MKIGLTKSVGVVFAIQCFLILFLLVGYVKDIIHLVHCDFSGPWKAEVLYGLGACTGLGGIFGWFNFGK